MDISTVKTGHSVWNEDGRRPLWLTRPEGPHRYQLCGCGFAVAAISGSIVGILRLLLLIIGFVAHLQGSLDGDAA